MTSFILNANSNNINSNNHLSALSYCHPHLFFFNLRRVCGSLDTLQTLSPALTR